MIKAKEWRSGITWCFYMCKGAIPTGEVTCLPLCANAGCQQLLFEQLYCLWLENHAQLVLSFSQTFLLAVSNTLFWNFMSV